MLLRRTSMVVTPCTTLLKRAARPRLLTISF
ncbi:Uncharacterized protein OBRU01_15064, partial [Operophtera brumata]